MGTRAPRGARRGVEAHASTLPRSAAGSSATTRPTIAARSTRRSPAQGQPPCAPPDPSTCGSSRRPSPVTWTSRTSASWAVSPTGCSIGSDPNSSSSRNPVAPVRLGCGGVCGRRRASRRRGSAPAPPGRSGACRRPDASTRPAMAVIGLPRIGVAASLRALDLGREPGGPFGPGNRPRWCSARVIANACASRLTEHRPGGLGGQLGDGLGCALRGSVFTGGHRAGSRYGSNASTETVKRWQRASGRAQTGATSPRSTNSCWSPASQTW
jgi:hypothetical protein